MKKVFAAVISSLILWSCNNSAEQSTTQQDAQTDTTQTGSDKTVELNNGEKWIVNEEMKPFVSKGAELVDVYIRESKTDFKELAMQLKEQNSQLVKSCTMKGKSHDELHKWLYPHLALVKQLESETDAAKAGEIVSQLQQSYQQYHQYFN